MVGEWKKRRARGRAKKKMEKRKGEERGYRWLYRKDKKCVRGRGVEEEREREGKDGKDERGKKEVRWLGGARKRRNG